MGGNMVKVLAWYDNEWGYASRTADLAAKRRQVSKSNSGVGRQGVLVNGCPNPFFVGEIMFNKKTIKDIDVKNKRVLVRVDFNVPLSDGKVTDDTRIRAALPTINYLLEQGAAVILCSHLGRPKTAADLEYSMRPTAEHLKTLIDAPVLFAEDCIGPKAEAAAAQLQPGQVLVLENTRFHPEETANDPEMSRQLAKLADVFVNDAFGSAHRAHASTVGVTEHLPSVAGFLLEKEIVYLGNAIADPKRPFVAIMGGAKISDKINVIRNLLQQGRQGPDRRRDGQYLLQSPGI